MRLRLLSWLVDVVCYGFVALSSYYFILYYYVQNHDDLRTVLSAVELPPAEMYALAQSLIFQKPVPESWRGPYMHLPSNKWIRLCRIVSKPHGDLAFTFDKFPLDAAPPYRALSYTWGRAEGGFVGGDGDRVNMKVNGRNHSTPMNAISAVLQLRNRMTDEYYWIDAICINQLDDKERSEQVNIMDKIFQRATAVDVWLGKAYPDTQKVNDIVHNLALLRQGEQESSPEDLLRTSPMLTRGDGLMPSDDWLTLVHILSRRWFHRLWTMQEFALAREVSMLCGNVTINMTDLLDATQFLSDHHIPMKLSYGNERRRTSATVLQLGLLREAIYGSEPFEFGSLECFHDLQLAAQLDYEILLVWVYWRSTATFATDPRDYVFGIIGVANAIANRMGLEYKPFTADYSLTTAEAFQAFVGRILNSKYGIRAIALIRQSADFIVRHPTDAKTEGLPSWVPDLANRDWYGLSTNGGLKHYGTQHSCQNIAGRRHANTERRLPFIKASALHLQAQRIGRIIESSSRFPDLPADVSDDFPNKSALEVCINFPLSLIVLLNQMPLAYPGTKQGPIEALLHTLRLGSNPMASPHDPRPSNNTQFERYIIQALQLHVFVQFIAQQEQTFQEAMSEFIIQTKFNAWPTIPGLGPTFIKSPLASTWEMHRHWLNWFNWLLPSNGSINYAMVRANALELSESCEAFHRSYGARVAATRLFLLQLDDDNNDPGPLQTGQDATEKALLLGLGPDTLSTGAEVWAAAGAEWPFIFYPRPTEDNVVYRDRNGMALDSFILQGEAYVHGIMHGELFENSEPHWQEVVLV